jgi:hypothetical protein
VDQLSFSGISFHNLKVDKKFWEGILKMRTTPRIIVPLFVGLIFCGSVLGACGGGTTSKGAQQALTSRTTTTMDQLETCVRTANSILSVMVADVQNNNAQDKTNQENRALETFGVRSRIFQAISDASNEDFSLITGNNADAAMKAISQTVQNVCATGSAEGNVGGPQIVQLTPTSVSAPSTSMQGQSSGAPSTNEPCYCPCVVNGVSVSCFSNPSTTLSMNVSSYVGTWTSNEFGNWNGTLVVNVDGSGTITEPPTDPGGSNRFATLQISPTSPGYASATISSGSIGMVEGVQTGPGWRFYLSSSVASQSCIGVSFTGIGFNDFCSN